MQKIQNKCYIVADIKYETSRFWLQLLPTFQILNKSIMPNFNMASFGIDLTINMQLNPMNCNWDKPRTSL
jgi:hypothetical protein